MKLNDLLALKACGCQHDKDALDELAAGGPGSGRHAMAETLKSHGFKFHEKTENNGPQTYTFKHPSGASVKFTSSLNNKWQPVDDWAHEKSDGTKKAGSGVVMLDYHLTNNKMQAGGPGSGRHPDGGDTSLWERGASRRPFLGRQSVLTYVNPGHPVHSTMHDSLSKTGFVFQGTHSASGLREHRYSEYEHPVAGFATTKPDGNWVLGKHSGKGIDALHLALVGLSKKPKLQAGGPGSGPQTSDPAGLTSDGHRVSVSRYSGNWESTKHPNAPAGSSWTTGSGAKALAQHIASLPAPTKIKQEIPMYNTPAYKYD